MPTLKEAQKDPNMTVIHTKITVPVKATDKHPAVRRLGDKPDPKLKEKVKKRQVPEHMVAHLVAKGMIEDPKKKATPKQAEK